MYCKHIRIKNFKLEKKKIFKPSMVVSTCDASERLRQEDPEFEPSLDQVTCPRRQTPKCLYESAFLFLRPSTQHL